MKIKYFIIIILLLKAQFSMAAGIPDPLKGIEITLRVEHGSRYIYSYAVHNPISNNGRVNSLDIFLGIDLARDKKLSTEGYSHCPIYLQATSESYVKTKFPTPVGSSAPNKWICGYAKRSQNSQISYSWSVWDQSVAINPGESKGGFELISQGLPGIREVQVRPEVNLSFEPNGGEPDLSVFRKVMWTGKTVGPKAPPKVFDPTKFIQYIESLLEESSKLGWVKTRGVENSLDKQLRAAEKQIGKNGNHPTQKMMEAFLKEVKNLKKKHLSPEGYALLYYNAQYFLDHLEVEKDHKDHKDHRGHKDRHKGKHGHHGRDEHHDHDRKHHKGHKDKEHERHHHHQDNHDKKHHDDHKKGHGDKYHGRK